MSGNKKLKILCLHGYRQNAEFFESMTAPLRETLKDYADFEFLSGPHVVTVPQKLMRSREGIPGNDDPRGWWLKRKDMQQLDPDQAPPDMGFPQALDMVVQHCTQNKYDGLLGFSQGACFVGLLLALQENKEIDLGIRFSIQIGSATSKLDIHPYHATTQITVPTLFIHGDNDKTIPKMLNNKLMTLYPGCSTRIEHEGGHMVPSCACNTDVLQQFFSQFM